jgi:hypothetical protein
MTILSNGNVGIGTTTPTALLDVNGDVVVAGDLTAENLIVGSTNVITEINTKQDLIDISITLEGFNISENINFLNSTNTDYEFLDYNFLNTLRLRNETFGSTLTANNIILSGDLTAENLIVGSTNVITEINTKQDIITDGSLTIARTDGLQTELNTKQYTITSATDLTCNKITTSSATLVSNIIAGFEFVKPVASATRINNTFDGANLFAYNTSTGITGFNGVTAIEFRINDIPLSNIKTSGFKIGASTSATEALDVAGNILASGSINANSAIINGVNINTTLTDILSRLTALENP